MSKKYFASLPADQIGKELLEKIESYYSYAQSSGHFTRIKDSYRMYYGYGPDGTSSDIASAGVQGELSSVVVNDFRSLLGHMLTLTTSQRPALKSRAINSDYRYQAQTLIADSALDYYLKEKKVERLLKDAVEQGLLGGEGFISLRWDVTAGEVYGVNPDDGSPIHEGDLEAKVHTVFDVIRDIRGVNQTSDWVIIRSFESKWELAAQFPELEDQIINAEIQSDFRNFTLNPSLYKDESDLVETYEFYHRTCNSVPNGRFIKFLGSDLILLDTVLPYEEVPVYRVAPANITGTIFGYTPAFDLLGISKVKNTLYSSVVTNQTAFAVQSIMVPKGSSLSVSELSSGLNLIQYDKNVGVPQPLQLTATPPEVFNFIKQLETKEEMLSGINSVVRGQPDASLKSGAALALVQSQAIQFMSGLSQAYSQLLEDCGRSIISILKEYAKSPKFISVAGKSNRFAMKSFSSDDLQGINGVTVEEVNPLSKTLAGKTELANNLLQTGLIKHAEQYLAVIQTGNLSPLTEADNSKLLNIRSENEALTEQGKPVTPILTDDHPLHIKEHLTLLDSPEARTSPELVQSVLGHVQEHLDLWRTMDPVLMQVLGMQPAPQEPSQGMPNPPSQVLDATNPVTQEAANVNMPNMPKIPQGPAQ
jgi:hypothetical protein